MATCLWAVFLSFSRRHENGTVCCYCAFYMFICAYLCSFVLRTPNRACLHSFASQPTPILHARKPLILLGFLYVRCCWCNLCRFFYKLPQNKNYRNFLHNPTQPTPIALIPVIPTVLALYNPTPTLHQPTPIRGLSCMLRGKQPSISTY